VLKEFLKNIEALKTYAICNDLHMEAYQPLQMANIAFEVTKGLVTKARIEKFDKHFTKNVIKPLEKNCVNACDP
jgi:hypothetical protein